MASIISKVDKTLVIPPKMRGIFPNDRELTINLPAGVPTEVPDYVAKYYTKNRPHVYRYSDQAEAEKEFTEPNKEVIKFDPLQWIELNYVRIEEAIQTLDRKELIAVGFALGLKGVFSQKNERIIERIIQDVKVKNSQQEELEKHEDAK